MWTYSAFVAGWLQGEGFTKGYGLEGLLHRLWFERTAGSSLVGSRLGRCLTPTPPRLPIVRWEALGPSCRRRAVYPKASKPPQLFSSPNTSIGDHTRAHTYRARAGNSNFLAP